MDSFIVKPARVSEGATVCSYTDWAVRQLIASFCYCYAERLDVARLRTALAQVLSDFPVYAGRFRTEQDVLLIEHAGSGAVLEVARSSEPFDALVRVAAKHGRGTLLAPAISARRALSGRGPLLGVRLTETVDGCVLGVTWHHSVGDMASIMQLLRALSHAYNNVAYDPPPSVLNREQYLAARLPDPVNSVSSLRVCPISELAPLVRFSMERTRRVDVEFGWDELAQLRHSALRESYISPSDALCGHAFTVLRALTPDRPLARLVLMVNYRKRVGLPANLLGNVINPVWMDVDASADPAAIAAGLRAKLNAYASQFSDYHATRRFLDEHPGRLERMRIVPRLSDASGGTLFVTNATSFGLYDLAFDGAAPALFAPLTDAHVPLIATVFERPNDSGVTLSLHLPEALARRVESPEGRAQMHKC